MYFALIIFAQYDNELFETTSSSKFPTLHNMTVILERKKNSIANSPSKIQQDSAYALTELTAHKNGLCFLGNQEVKKIQQEAYRGKHDKFYHKDTIFVGWDILFQHDFNFLQKIQTSM